jgi:hypothetical protein
MRSSPSASGRAGSPVSAVSMPAVTAGVGRPRASASSASRDRPSATASGGTGRANLVVHFAPSGDPASGAAPAPPARFVLGEVYRFDVVRTPQGMPAHGAPPGRRTGIVRLAPTATPVRCETVRTWSESRSSS